MRIEQLEYLAAVTQHGSLRRASESLHISQPALSEAVGTGPMQLVEYVQDDVVIMEAFPDYWGDGIPCIGKLTLKTSTASNKPAADEKAQAEETEVETTRAAFELDKPKTSRAPLGPKRKKRS